MMISPQWADEALKLHQWRDAELPEPYAFHGMPGRLAKALVLLNDIDDDAGVEIDARAAQSHASRSSLI